MTTQGEGTSASERKSIVPKLRVSSFAVSIDGFGAGPDQDLENPIGQGGGYGLAKQVAGERATHVFLRKQG